MVLFREYLVFLIIRVAIAVIQALPLTACHTWAGWMATLAHDVVRLRRKVTDENLRHAYPELNERQRQRLAWRMWEHLFLFVVEVAHTPRKVHHTNWRDHVTLRNPGVLVRMLLSDRSMILVGAHYGNFELNGYMLGLFGYSSYAVARPLDNPYLDVWLNSFRGSTGQRMLSKSSDYEKIVELLGSGATICFLADQYAGAKGCWVDFFGRPASAHKAIGLFSLQHDAPIAVGSCRRIGGPLEYEVTLEAYADPRDVTPEVSGLRELTQWYTGEMEKFIRRSPEQYWWLHRRWKDHRPEKKRVKKAA